MANTIQLLRSATHGNVPSELVVGELAINYTDGLLFWLDNNSIIRKAQLFPAPMSALAASNLAINGGFAVSQINGANSIAPGTGSYVVDGFKAGFINSGAVFAAQQIAPPGTPSFALELPYCLQLKATSAIAALAASDYVTISTPIEGYRWARLGYGGSGGQSVTVGFWLYADEAGTASLTIQNAAINRSYVTTFSVAVGWQWIVLVVPPDTAGTWLNTNGVGALLTWCLGCGSNFQTTANAWTAGNYLGASTNTNLFGSNDNRVCITGVVIVGGALDLPSVQAPLMIDPFNVELQKCRRYWRKSYDYATLPGAAANYGNVAKSYMSGLSSAVYSGGGHIEHGMPMRTAATLTGYSPASGVSGKAYDANASADVSATLENAGENGFNWRATNSAAATGMDLRLHWTADARL